MIQCNWRRLAAVRHVLLMKLVVHEIRVAIAMHRTKASEQDPTRLKVTAKDRFRELSGAVMFAVKKCIQAYKATEHLKNDRVQRERVAMLRARRHDARTAVLELRNRMNDCQGPETTEALDELEEAQRIAMWLDSQGPKEVYACDRAARRIQAAWFRICIYRQEKMWRRLQAIARSRPGTSGHLQFAQDEDHPEFAENLEDGSPSGDARKRFLSRLRCLESLEVAERASSNRTENKLWVVFRTMLDSAKVSEGREETTNCELPNTMGSQVADRGEETTEKEFANAGDTQAVECSSPEVADRREETTEKEFATAGDTQAVESNSPEEATEKEFANAVDTQAPGERRETTNDGLPNTMGAEVTDRREETAEEEFATPVDTQVTDMREETAEEKFATAADTQVSGGREKTPKDELANVMNTQVSGRKEEATKDTFEKTMELLFRKPVAQVSGRREDTTEQEFANAMNTQVSGRREETTKDEFANNMDILFRQPVAQVSGRREETAKDEFANNMDILFRQPVAQVSSRREQITEDEFANAMDTQAVDVGTSESEEALGRRGEETKDELANAMGTQAPGRRGEETKDVPKASFRRRVMPLAPLSAPKSNMPAERQPVKEGSLEEAHRALQQRRGPPRPQRPPQTARRHQQTGSSRGLSTRISVVTTPRTPALLAGPASRGPSPISSSFSPVMSVTPTESRAPQTGSKEGLGTERSRPLGLLLGVAVGGRGTDAGDSQLVVLGVGPGPVKDDAMRKGLGPRLRRGDRLLRVGSKGDLGEMIARLADPQGTSVELEVELRTSKEASEAAEAAVPIEPGDRLLGPASTECSGGAQGPGLFCLERAATLALLPEWQPQAGGPEGPQAGPFSPVPTWERQLVAAAQRPRRAPGESPQWLADSPFTPLLRETICALGAGDALELLFKLDSSTGWSGRGEAHVTIRHELHAATCAGGDFVFGGGAGVWAALEAGVSGCTARGSSEVLLAVLDPRLWCEALFHFGVLAMQRERDRLTDLQDDWTLRSVRGGWRRRLESLEEALGWCAQCLDVLQAVRELTGPAMGSTTPNSPIDAIPPVKLSSKHVVLEREVQRAEREIAALRRREVEEAEARAKHVAPVAKRGLEWVQAAKARRMEAEARQREEMGGPLSFEAWKESSLGRRAVAGASLREPKCTWLPSGAFPAPPPLPPGPRRREAVGPAGAGTPRSRRFCAMAPARGIVVA